MTLVVRRWSLKCGRVLDQGPRGATHLLRLPRRAPAISDGAGLDTLGSCSWCPASSGLAGVRASLLKARSALSCYVTDRPIFLLGKNRNRATASSKIFQNRNAHLCRRGQNQ